MGTLIDFIKRSKIYSNTCCAALFFLVLSGCQTQQNWYSGQDFGSEVNNAILIQRANPNSPLENSDTRKFGLDGVAAKGTMDQYQRSYEVRTTGSFAISPNPTTPPPNIPR